MVATPLVPAQDPCPTAEVMDTHIGPASRGGSQPQEMSGPNAHCYVKFPNNPQGRRVLYNEQVVGRIAEILSCPCPGVVPVSVDSFLASTIHFTDGTEAEAGLAHGSRYIPRVDQVDLATSLAAAAANRERYISLMVLFTITGVQDVQFVYQIDAPSLLFSVDHGWAFGGTPNWDEASLLALTPPTAIMAHGPAFTSAEAAAAVPGLQLLTDDVLGEIVDCPPDWGVSGSERTALRAWLRQRVDAVVTILGVAP